MTTLVPSFLDESFSFLHITRPTIKALICLNFGKISSLTSELAALERQKNSFLQATSKPIISRMGSKLSRVRLGTYELTALERLEKSQ